MTLRRCVATMAPLLGAVSGCGTSTEPGATLTAVSPAFGFNDTAMPVTIAGESFRPSFRFDTMGGAANTQAGAFSATLTPVGGAAADAISLGDVAWQSPVALAATIPAGVPKGHYDVAVTDPRGARVHLDDGFVSLGPDTDAPTVMIVNPAPGTLITGGTTVTVTLFADDGDGTLATLAATISSEVTPLPCDVPPKAHQRTCDVTFVAPEASDQTPTIAIGAHATDSAGNDGVGDATPFRLVPRPTVTGLSVTSGPAAGGVEIVVTGTNFIEPADPSDGSELRFDGRAVQPIAITPTAIRAVTPNHDPGFAAVTVANGTGESAQKVFFEFVGPPIIRLVTPLRGPVTGGTPISIAGNYFRESATTIFIDGYPLVCQTFVDSGHITGLVPAWVGPYLKVPIVAADDSIGAKSTYSLPFVYEPAATDPADGGVGDPMACPGAP